MLSIFCPVQGEVKDISTANDPAFAKKMLGDGVCISPTNSKVVSPVDGVVSVVFPTGHAVGIESNGVEILLHLGIDTVELNGKHFTKKVSVGDKVSQGTLLIDYDYQSVISEGYDADVMVIITSKGHNEISKNLGNKDTTDIVLTV